MLIYPPKTFFEQGAHVGESIDIGLPLGIMYIGAVLEQAGHSVKIIDSLVEYGAKHFERDGYKRFGLPDFLLKKKIEEFKPDIVGISGQFTAQIDNVVNTAKIVKSVDSNIKVFVGGPHVSVKGKEFMETNPEIDVAIVGEGESIAPKLVSAFENDKELSSVEGILYSDGGGVVQTKRAKFVFNLDDIPFPAYHLVQMDKYLNLHKYGFFGRRRDEKAAVSIITSRGCPNECIFCSIHLHMGRAWRAHSADYVLKHIDLLVNKYKVSEIQIEDDNFTLDYKRADKILTEIIKRKYSLSIITPNGVRADGLDRELLIKFKKAGLRELVIAPESGNQEVLDKIVKKRMDLKQVVKIAKTAAELKIPTIAWFIIGFPGEKKHQIKDTLEFGLMLNKKYGVLTRGAIYATPLYGTELYDICDKNNYFVREITPAALGKATMSNGVPLLKTEDFDPEFLKKINNEYIKKGTIVYLKRNWYRPFKLWNYAGGLKGVIGELKKLVGAK